MKIGLSTYSLVDYIYSKKMTVLDVMQWIKDNGGEHVEIVPFGFTLAGNPSLVEEIRKKSEDIGLEISMYSILANLIQDTEENYEKEVKRLMEAVDITNALGAKYMRHDAVTFRNIPKEPVGEFERDLPKVVAAYQRIADYAAQYGITTTMENHGFYFNGSERVKRVVFGVNRPNFKTTVDVGNFLCVDQDPLCGVKDDISYADVVHLKDFYIRKDNVSIGNVPEGINLRYWFPSVHGNYLRGAIVGNGDIDMVSIIKAIKQSGFDGYVSIEFEGMEEQKIGAKLGMDNARRLFNTL